MPDLRVPRMRAETDIVIEAPDGSRVVIPREEAQRRLDELADYARRLYREALGLILYAYPSLYMFVSSLPVLLDPASPTSYTDGEAVYLGLSALSPREMPRHLVHEAMHVLLEHPERYARLEERAGLPRDAFPLANIAMDYKAELGVAAVMDTMFALAGEPARYRLHEALEEALAEYTGREPGWLRSASFEEILVALLERNAGRSPREIAAEILRRLGAPAGGDIRPGYRAEGVVTLSPGRPGWRRFRGAYRERFRSELERRLKYAGEGAGGVLRELGAADRFRVDWRRHLLARAYSVAYGDSWRLTWHRVNRKLPFLRPGRRPAQGYRAVYFLVDTSGSVTRDELAAFIHEVAEVVGRRAEVKLVAWDWEVEGVTVLRPGMTREQVLRHLERAGTVAGMGGTRLAPALDLVEAELRARPAPRALVVVASDFVLTDRPGDVSPRLRRLVSLGAEVVFLATTPGYRDYVVEGVTVYEML